LPRHIDVVVVVVVELVVVSVSQPPAEQLAIPDSGDSRDLSYTTNKRAFSSKLPCHGDVQR